MFSFLGSAWTKLRSSPCHSKGTLDACGGKEHVLRETSMNIYYKEMDSTLLWDPTAEALCCVDPMHTSVAVTHDVGQSLSLKSRTWLELCRFKASQPGGLGWAVRVTMPGVRATCRSSWRQGDINSLVLCYQVSAIVGRASFLLFIFLAFTPQHLFHEIEAACREVLHRKVGQLHCLVYVRI